MVLDAQSGGGTARRKEEGERRKARGGGVEQTRWRGGWSVLDDGVYDGVGAAVMAMNE